MKKKKDSPFRLRTEICTKVQRTKIYLKRCETKPFYDGKEQEVKTLYYLVTSKGFNRRFSDRDQAWKCFTQFVNFEQHQTVLYHI